MLSVQGLVDIAETKVAYLEVRAGGDWWRTPLMLDGEHHFDQLQLIRQLNLGIGGTFGHAYWRETLPVGP